MRYIKLQKICDNDIPVDILIPTYEKGLFTFPCKNEYREKVKRYAFVSRQYKQEI